MAAPNAENKTLPALAMESAMRSHGASSTSLTTLDDGNTHAASSESITTRRDPEYGEKDDRVQASEGLRRVASNAIARIGSRLTTHSLKEPPPPPDGGVKAWTQVACGWAMLFSTWGYVNSFGTFQTYYTSTLPQSASMISWIGSIQCFLTFSIGAFSGRLTDAGYFLPTFLVGAVLQLLGIFLMSTSTKYWQLMLTQGVLTGIGNGTLFTPALTVLTTYFDHRRAVAVGLATLGNSTGGIIYPLIVRQLLPRVGFAWACRVLGFVNLACLSIVAAFMRPRVPPRKSGPLIDWTAFKEPIYMGYVWGMFCWVWGNYYTFDYDASYGEQVLGLSYTNAFILIIIINGTGLPARVILPIFADRIGPLNLIAPVALCVAITSFCWLAVRNLVGFYVFTVFYGIFSGAFQCLMPTGAVSITKRLDMVGTRLGMLYSIISVAALTGPPLGGAIMAARHGSFTAAQVWAAVVSVFSTALLFTARMFRSEWKIKARC